MLPCLCSRKSLSSISSMPGQSLRTSLVFLDLAINSFLSRTILVFNSVPLCYLMVMDSHSHNLESTTPAPEHFRDETSFRDEGRGCFREKKGLLDAHVMAR